MSRLIRANIKPLSSNKMWLGTKRKSALYRKFEKELLAALPRTRVSRNGPLELEMRIYVSSKLFDTDNALKPFIDVLQKRYNFNDNRIYKITIEKIIVPKGEEAIEFRLRKY